jgi:preprotein translocase subunit SecD
MKKRYRLLLTIALIAVSFYLLWPSILWYFLTPQSDKEIAESSRNQIKVYAQEKAQDTAKRLFGTALDSPLPAEFDFLIPKAKARLASAKVAAPSIWTVKSVLDAYADQADLSADIEDFHRARMFALKDLRNKTIQLGLDLRGGQYVTIRADFAALEETTKKTLTSDQRQDKMNGALEALRNRIDQYGLSEPSIRQQGTDEIVVEIPGTQDPERVNSFIQGKGILTFHIVDEEATAKVIQYQTSTGKSIFDAAGNVKDPEAAKLVPAGDKLLGVYEKDSYGLDELKGSVVIIEKVGLNGSEIQDAQVVADPVDGKPNVVFSLSPAGGDIFWQLTKDNKGKLLCVVLDNKIKSNPATISTAIRDQVRVTGFNLQEALDLALVLRTGSLPVPLEIISKENIGASLGSDQINQGIRASLVGLALVFAFMLLYYRRAGLNAIVAQILNLYFIVAILSRMNFTLTLAAIAGLILNVGMAVDASVLIFERMKEEMKLGKSAQAVVKAGFDRAFWAIADSNITTIIAAIVLSFLAKGSIRGFAITLAVGNLATLFTTVFVSRLIFDFNVDVFKVRRIVVSWRKLA